MTAVDDARTALTEHLLPGETLEWTGCPDPAKHLGPSDLFLVPFSVLWTAFAVFWTVWVLRDGAGVLFALSGLLFVLIGAFFVGGRFL